MALKTTVEHLKNLLHEISHDLEKAERGNKAASQRVRTNTIRFAKIAKEYRKESIAEGRGGKAKRAGTRKTAKKKTATKRKTTARRGVRKKTSTRRRR